MRDDVIRVADRACGCYTLKESLACLDGADPAFVNAQSIVETRRDNTGIFGLANCPDTDQSAKSSSLIRNF